MKKFISLALVAFVLTAVSAAAMPTGNSYKSRNYVVNSSDLSRWTVGYFSDKRDRFVLLPSRTTMVSANQMLYIGYDIIPEIMLYGVIGDTDTRFGSRPFYNDTSYAAGLRIGLLDEDIMETMEMEDRVRLTATFQHGWFSSIYRNNEIEWKETYGSLVASVVNDIEGNKMFFPKAIAIYAGLIYSDLDDSSVVEKKKTGFTYGLEFYFGEKISMDLGVDRIDNESYRTGFQLRF